MYSGAPVQSPLLLQSGDELDDSVGVFSLSRHVQHSQQLLDPNKYPANQEISKLTKNSYSHKNLSYLKLVLRQEVEYYSLYRNTEMPSKRLNLVKQCFYSFQNFNVALMSYHLGNKNNKTVNRRATPTIQLSWWQT